MFNIQLAVLIVIGERPAGNDQDLPFKLALQVEISICGLYFKLTDKEKQEKELTRMKEGIEDVLEGSWCENENVKHTPYTLRRDNLVRLRVPFHL